MKGADTANNTGSYGSILVSSPLNCPSARGETSASWTDNNNNLWLFGGVETYMPQGQGTFSDLWKYAIATNQWTWMKGPDTTNQPSVYGIKGVPDSANIPSGRWSYAKWKDSNDNLWFFGGVGSVYYNDMWRYNISSNQWTWM